MQSRYTALITQLADKTATEINRALDAEVTRKLADKFATDANVSKEACDLAAYLRQWLQTAKLTQWSVIGFSAISLSIASQLTGINRLLLTHCSLIGYAIAKRQHQTCQQVSPIIGTIAQIQAAESAMALAQMWQKQPQLQQQANPLEQPQLQPQATAIKMFDWDDLRDPDRFVHLLILGETGSGKTFTAEKIIRSIGCPYKVITTKRKSHQWEGAEVIGTPRDFEAIRQALQTDLDDMQKRMENLDYEWEPEFTIVDELSAIARNIPESGDYFGSFICEARETRKRFAFLAHGTQVKLLGLEGQSDLIDGLLHIRLGKYAIDHAEKLAKKKRYQPLFEWVNSQERPIVVDDKPAMLP